MERMLDSMLGKILLVGGILWVVVMWYLNPKVELHFEQKDQAKEPQKVQVKFDKEKLLTASPEVHFIDKPRGAYFVATRFPFVPPKKIFRYESVDLAVPTTTVMDAPMVLPSPGPKLEGTHGLPRWEKEMPKMVVPEPADDKSNRPQIKATVRRS